MRRLAFALSIAVALPLTLPAQDTAGESILTTGIGDQQQQQQQRREQARVQIDEARLLMLQMQAQAAANMLFRGDGRQEQIRVEVVLRRPEFGRAQFVATLQRDVGRPHEFNVREEDRNALRQDYVQACRNMRATLSACNLPEAHWTKLEQAAKGDAARLIHRGVEAFRGSRASQQDRDFDPTSTCAELNQALREGLTAKDSLFLKVLNALLTADQREALLRARVAEVLDKIDNFARLPLDAQVRHFKLPYPSPGSGRDVDSTVCRELSIAQRSEIECLFAAAMGVDFPLDRVLQQDGTDWLANQIAEEALVDALSPGQLLAFRTLYGQSDARLQEVELQLDFPQLRLPQPVAR